MKRPANLSLIGILAGCVCGAAADAAGPVDCHVVVSPFLAPTTRTNVFRGLLSWLLQEAPEGSRVRCLDGWTLTRFADFQVPVLKMQSPALRAERMGSAVGGLRRWFGSAAAGGVAALANSAALRLPEWSELMAQEPASGPRLIILLGSPIYRSLEEPAFDMGDGRYPSDGHLNCPDSESLFGTRDRAGFLERTTVYWWMPPEVSWLNGRHRQMVLRFWSLWTDSQGGHLGVISPDLSSILLRDWPRSVPHRPQFQRDPADDKPVMKTAAPRQIPDWLPAAPVPSPESGSSDATGGRVPSDPTPALQMVSNDGDTSAPSDLGVMVPEADEPSGGVPVATPAMAPILAPIPVQPAMGTVGIGIVWSDPVDLDLYVRPGAEMRELSFRTTATAQGRYFHDYRSANMHLDYEYVELIPGTDPATVEVWINYFRGTIQGPRGRVCLMLHGRTIEAPFRIAATRGNAGAGMHARDRNPQWVRVDLSSLVAGWSSAADHGRADP